MINCAISTQWFTIISVAALCVFLALWFTARRRAAAAAAEQLSREHRQRIDSLVDQCYAAACRLDSLTAYQRLCGACINGDTGLLSVYRRVSDCLAEGDDMRRARGIEKAANFLLNMATARRLSNGGAWHMPSASRETIDRRAYVERLGTDLGEASLEQTLSKLRDNVATAEKNTRMSDALSEWLQPAGDFAALADDSTASPEAMTARARAFINVSSKIIEKYGFEL